VSGVALRVAGVQLNIANPSTGCMKVVEVDDEKTLYVADDIACPVSCAVFVCVAMFGWLACRARLLCAASPLQLFIVFVSISLSAALRVAFVRHSHASRAGALTAGATSTTSASRRRLTARPWARSSRATSSGVLMCLCCGQRCRHRRAAPAVAALWWHQLCSLEHPHPCDHRRDSRCCALSSCSISGGNDKQGFPMQQGILVNQRVRLLMAKGALQSRVASLWKGVLPRDPKPAPLQWQCSGNAC
jgi:hypothetical protein